MDCPHPPNKRFTYRDAAAPLGREGQEWCDECDQPVDPDDGRCRAVLVDLRPILRERVKDRLLADLIAILEREA